ncbi:MAG: polyprenyl diphosphate synthase, partial [Clostridia bacterium]
LSRMPQEVKDRLDKCIALTAHNTKLTLVLALSYSSKSEMTGAVKEIALSLQKGEITIDQIDEQLIENHLLTKNLPNPDLLIRTGGEVRISNFLLWQSAYAELIFIDDFWPDFNKKTVENILKEYSARDRRFGAIK